MLVDKKAKKNFVDTTKPHIFADDKRDNTQINI